MPDIATVLRLETRRIARKELRAETSTLKKAASTQRSEIAALKRRVLELERQVRQLSGNSVRSTTQAPDGEASVTKGRYSAKSLAAQRRRLGLSAHDLGRLIGVSSQSIYNWEDRKTRPQARHLPAVMALKTLGKRAAAEHLRVAAST